MLNNAWTVGTALFDKISQVYNNMLMFTVAS